MPPYARVHLLYRACTVWRTYDHSWKSALGNSNPSVAGLDGAARGLFKEADAQYPRTPGRAAAAVAAAVVAAAATAVATAVEVVVAVAADAILGLARQRPPAG